MKKQEKILQLFKEAIRTDKLDEGKKNQESITHNIEISQNNIFDEADIRDSPTE